MALKILAQEKVLLEESKYVDAEHVYYENQSEIQKCETLGDTIPKIKSENVTNCEDCSMCDIMTQIYLYNDVSKLLDNVQQWDKIDSIMNDNQYKKIIKFECLVCSFKTIQFNDWKYHIMSVTHIAKSHRIKNLFSYACSNKKCKLLLYGSEKSLNEHQIEKHSNDGNINSSISILMAEVMKKFLAADQSPLFYCSHCSKFKKEPIHIVDVVSRNKIKVPIEYYCKFCKIQFLSSHEMIDFHSLSVEHMTLKCFDELCSKAKKNSKKIKLLEELNQYNENNLSVKTNSVNMPNMILTKSPTTVKNKNMSTDSIQSIKPNTPQDGSLSQTFKNDITSEHSENLQPYKSLTNFVCDGTILLDNLEKVQLFNPVENDSTLVKSQNEIMSNLGETTCPLNSSLTKKTQIFENIKVGELDEDQLYGEYVVQRLKNIKNTTIKQHIQLEIDNIFYINMKQLFVAGDTKD